jgi:hypothetical protein
VEFVPGDAVDRAVLARCAAELGALFATGASHVVLERGDRQDTVALTELEALLQEPFGSLALASLDRAQLPWPWRLRATTATHSALVLELPANATLDRALDADVPRNAHVVHLDARASVRRRGAFLPAVLVRGQVDPATFHALAAWAFHHGAFRAVRWHAPDAVLRAEWTSLDDVPAPIAHAVRALHGHVTDDAPAPTNVPLAPHDASLAERLAAVVGDPVREAEALGAQGDTRIEVISLTTFAGVPFRTPAPDDTVLVCAPGDDGIRLALAPGLVGAKRVEALLHAWAHIALGHVRPGDAYALWDTAATLTAEHTLRRWDREIRTAFPVWFEPPKPTCLDECTVRDKAMLGLHRIVRDRLGGTETLHDAAQRYQHAAYQRQAAQRLVAQLDSARGAMLCDGVGLGKTYVATTVLVHYANVTRIVGEPLRVTVLAPGSVVETWAREALPPLGAFGVDTARVRVISHAKLSRITAGSAVLTPTIEGISDLEHLLRSDLVIVDEAHNFRAASARRTLALRDILRLRLRRSRHRKVLLLTATPINNSLEDLEQECALLFSEPFAFPTLTARTDDAWDAAALKELTRRCERARASANRQRDVLEEILHGPDGRIRGAFNFRSDLNLGTHNLARYLKDQEATLQSLRERIRSAAAKGERDDGPRPRIAEELLDRVVVQRSRALCKKIEEQEGSRVALLFRKNAGEPERLRYADAYDGTTDVLAQFLPLFDERDEGATPLSFKVYMWHDVEAGTHSADDAAPTVGLQRVLALKRLESSPVTFLITVLRLTVLHASRVEMLVRRCHKVGLAQASQQLQRDCAAMLQQHRPASLGTLRWLTVGDRPVNPAHDFFERLAEASRFELDPEEAVVQHDLFSSAAPSATPDDELARMQRLLGLRDLLLNDLRTLLGVVPKLAAIVFGRFDVNDWPARFSAPERRWPRSHAWARRMESDPKLRVLFQRLLRARAEGRKVLVFSQFTDTIAYIQSVLDACRDLDLAERRQLLADMEIEQDPSAFTQLIEVTASVTGETDDRDRVIDRFAPFYRLRPTPPSDELITGWESDWLEAIRHPIDVLLASDVLAEGVNLQDVSLLINVDVHWNPVRMIQRAGRIDRRLDPRIEDAGDFPHLHQIAQRAALPTPRYAWEGRRHEPPVVANMILPDALEAQLALRERLATKTLAIDFTLGLERGTGAEAEWMHGYRFHGVASLNAFEHDRAIERLGASYRLLEHALARRGVDLAWSDGLNAWIRDERATDETPAIARALLSSSYTELKPYARYLEPLVADGTAHWLWTTEPASELLSHWLPLSEDHIGEARRDLPFRARASQPLRPDHLLAAAEVILDEVAGLIERPTQDAKVGAEVFQAMPAVAAGYFGARDERLDLQMDQVVILQLHALRPSLASIERDTE